MGFGFKYLSYRLGKEQALIVRSFVAPKLEMMVVDQTYKGLFLIFWAQLDLARGCCDA